MTQTRCSRTNQLMTSDANFNFTLVALTAGNIPLSMAASFGNILILVALRKDCSLHPPSRLLFRCLALTDLFVGIVSQPLFVVYLLSLFNKQWMLSCFIEAFQHVAGAVLVGLSLCTLTVITIDRLLALLLRLRYRTVVTVSRVRKLMLFVLILNVAVAMTSIWKEKLFFTLLFTFLFIFGIITTCCYLKMYLTFRRQSRIHVELRRAKEETNSSLNMGRFKKTVSTILWVQGALILCFFPFGVTKAVSNIATNNSFLLRGELWTVTLVYCNSSLNPVLYCWRVPQIREAVREAIKKVCRQHAHESESH